MRLCVSLSRGVAAPLGCVIFSVSVEIYGFTPRTQGFLCVRGGGGITTPGALRTAEVLGARLSKRLICRFLRSDGCRSLYGIFSDISARKIRL